jgi:hypothetical protein
MLTQSFCKFCGGFIRNIHGSGEKQFTEQHANTSECLETLGGRCTDLEAKVVVLTTMFNQHVSESRKVGTAAAGGAVAGGVRQTMQEPPSAKKESVSVAKQDGAKQDGAPRDGEVRDGGVNVIEVET